MYKLLSDSYQRGHSYNAWLVAHADTQAICVLGAFRQSYLTVSLTVWALDRAPGGQLVRNNYQGFWKVEPQANGSFKLTAVDLQPTTS